MFMYIIVLHVNIYKCMYARVCVCVCVVRVCVCVCIAASAVVFMYYTCINCIVYTFYVHTVECGGIHVYIFKYVYIYIYIKI